MQSPTSNSHKFCAVVILLCLTLIVYLAVGCVSPPTTVTHTTTSTKPSINVYFSPGGNCTARIVDEINLAKKEILVQAYSFTSKPIADALIDAHKRIGRTGSVTILLDKSQLKAKGSQRMRCQKNNIPIFNDEHSGIAHNKIIIIDGKTLITGSFNFSEAAETSNAENILIIKGYPDIISRYIQNWLTHEGHSSLFDD